MAKAKTKTAFVCSECGADYPKWQGQCAACGKWNTLSRVFVDYDSAPSVGFAGETSELLKLKAVSAEEVSRIPTGVGELDRVLGGGLVPGSVILMGGDPGAGKSTLLLQVATKLASKEGVLYVTGEESLQQVALRAQRLNLPLDDLDVASEIRAESIKQMVDKVVPKILVIDSIQVMQLSEVGSAPGSVNQVRETAAYFTRLAKQKGTIVILVGHVTKEGGLAGPKILEHMIDTFIMLDNSSDGRYRILRGHKNRFGAVNEIGIFAMTDQGMREVPNPSAIFLQRGDFEASGSVTTVTWEGTRSLLVEIQALADDSSSNQPRRIAVGIDHQRLSMQLAIMNRHCAISLSNQDVFINVVGGVRIQETGSDLALVLAVLSSLNNRSLPRDLVTFGEVGLTGELRPVVNGQERLREASKHGFKKAIVPFANQPKDPIPGLSVYAVKHLSAALEAVEAI